MRILDPRDQWEFHRIKTASLSRLAPRPQPGASVKVLHPRAGPGVQSLRHILDRDGRLSLDRSLHLALAMCVELSRIHAAGAVHGELNPESVSVGSDGGVSLIQPDASIVFSWDCAASVSPEQIRGRRPTERSDVYALGTILYEMLTGAPAFTGIDSLSIMRDAMTCEPDPLTKLNPSISPQLEAIVLRATAPHPKKRYSTIGDLGWALSHQEIVPLPRPESGRRFPTVLRKRRVFWDVLRALGPVTAVAAVLYGLVEMI